MNGCRLLGMLKEEQARVRLIAGKPREGGSARFSRDGTYKEEIHNL